MSQLQKRSIEGNGAGSPEARRAVGERAAEASGSAGAEAVPDPELVERAQRRRFSSAYKLRILREADGLSRPGEIGALLRREGLYSSHLSVWRRQRDDGTREALSRPRGRKPADPLLAEMAELRGRLTRTESDLALARRVIEAQGNVCALLGEVFEPRGATEPEPTKP